MQDVKADRPVYQYVRRSFDRLFSNDSREEESNRLERENRKSRRMRQRTWAPPASGAVLSLLYTWLRRCDVGLPDVNAGSLRARKFCFQNRKRYTRGGRGLAATIRPLVGGTAGWAAGVSLGCLIGYNLASKPVFVLSHDRLVFELPCERRRSVVICQMFEH